jgi:hypothetical protein
VALLSADNRIDDFLKSTNLPNEIAAVTLRVRLIDAQGRFSVFNLCDRKAEN